MTKGMQVRLTESRARCPLTRDEWNALVVRNPTNTAFQTFEWFDTWWGAFAARHRLHLLTVHEGDRILGIAPFMMLRGPLGLKQLELIGTPNADYQDLIVPDRRDEVIRALCEFLHAERRSWDMIVLRSLPERSPTVAEFRKHCEALGLGVMDLERQPCPAVMLAGREAETRRALGRYSLRRSHKRLAQRGALRFRVYATREEVDQALPAFFEQHVQRWKETGDPSPFTDPAFRDWYRALAAAAHAARWLHFSVLECDGKPAAFHFGFQYGRTLSWYKPSFDWEFHRESPGAVLITQLIEDALARGLAELDFSSGLESFKLRFSNTESFNRNLRVFSRPLLHCAFTAGGHLRNAAGGAWRRVRGRRRAALPSA